MKYLLAVSGGVDSMVLLDRFVRNGKGFAVAHFDHGMRKESAGDAEFVRQKCMELGVKCFIGRGNLGVKASEDKARKVRYEFLKSVAGEMGGATVVTAHHKDDLLETIVMNLIRGTGWRGLAPMNSGVERPLVGMWKTEVVVEAIERGLEWVEDETNYSTRYFRNRVREVLYGADGGLKRKILKLYEKQKMLRGEIDKTLICGFSHHPLSQANLRDLVTDDLVLSRSCIVRLDSSVQALQQPLCAEDREKPIRIRMTFDRKWLMEMDDGVAKEVLNHVTAGRLTGLQLGRVVEFVRMSKPAKRMIFKEVEVVVAKNTIVISDLAG